MARFLLEVLTEEIPANALEGARRQLAAAIASGLEEAGFEEASVRSLSTSRRLIVTVEGLDERQADRTERVSGPPASVAFDDGRPTKAAEGFARKVGLAVDELETDTGPKGDYLAATVTHVGRPTGEILAELVPAAVGDVRFPKMMRWGRGEHAFVRPVHGVVALLDDAVVPLELFGISSGNRTEGHRVHSPEPFEIDHAESYVAALEGRRVLVDPDERRGRFAARATELVSEVGCRVHPDEALVAKHVELVEYPGLLLGDFD